MRIQLAILAIALSVSILSTGAARAEGFIDVYLGGSYTDDATSRASGGASPPASREFDNSVIGGVRGGGWLGPLPWLGFAGDISYFRPDGDISPGGDDIHVIPISLQVMLRLPIFTSDEIPGGRIQPYVAAGPALFVSVIQARDFFAAGADFVSVDARIGSDVRGGVKVHLLSWLAVFAEYRHTQFDARWDDELGFTDGQIKSEIETHHFQLGVGFHF